jgi:hypothetical protein
MLWKINVSPAYHENKPYGNLGHMAAKPIYRDKYIYADGAIREMVIWQLPKADNERLHGLKYRLYYGYPGNCPMLHPSHHKIQHHRSVY